MFKISSHFTNVCSILPFYVTQFHSFFENHWHFIHISVSLYTYLSVSETEFHQWNKSLPRDMFKALSAQTLVYVLNIQVYTYKVSIPSLTWFKMDKKKYISTCQHFKLRQFKLNSSVKKIHTCFSVRHCIVLYMPALFFCVSICKQYLLRKTLFGHA